ncbi:MAG: hypothetical protein VKK04_23875, partial [Synechococcales bacterium]|nr:hypothetical protein [Synechococcales bacterium]
MVDFLSYLVNRAQGHLPLVQPRFAARFAPDSKMGRSPEELPPVPSVLELDAAIPAPESPLERLTESGPEEAIRRVERPPLNYPEPRQIPAKTQFEEFARLEGSQAQLPEPFVQRPAKPPEIRSVQEFGRSQPAAVRQETVEPKTVELKTVEPVGSKEISAEPASPEPANLQAPQPGTPALPPPLIEQPREGRSPAVGLPSFAKPQDGSAALPQPQSQTFERPNTVQPRDAMGQPPLQPYFMPRNETQDRESDSGAIAPIPPPAQPTLIPPPSPVSQPEATARRSEAPFPQPAEPGARPASPPIASSPMPSSPQRPPPTPPPTP